MTLIGLPSTVLPKSSIAICADVTEPWPVGVDAGPFMSVSTPILTTSSEIWAWARVDASIAAASVPRIERFLAYIAYSSRYLRRIGRYWSSYVLAIIPRLPSTAKDGLHSRSQGTPRGLPWDPKGGCQFCRCMIHHRL